MLLRPVVAVLLGTLVFSLASSASGADDEQAVVDAIRKAGGSVRVDDKAPDKPVTNVNFDGDKKKLTDEVVAKIVPQLAALKKLRGLNVSNRKTSDTTLQLIGKTLPDLQELSLDDSVITDDGLKALEGMKKLESLQINGATAVTDEGVKSIGKIATLKKLGLDRTKITDDGMKSIKNLSNLVDFRITETAVTDAGLRELKNIATLEYVYALKSKITKNGAADLKKALPKVYVAGP
jgi:hypothetical protein